MQVGDLVVCVDASDRGLTHKFINGYLVTFNNTFESSVGVRNDECPNGVGIATHNNPQSAAAFFTGAVIAGIIYGLAWIVMSVASRIRW